MKSTLHMTPVKGFRDETICVLDAWWIVPAQIVGHLESPTDRTAVVPIEVRYSFQLQIPGHFAPTRGALVGQLLAVPEPLLAVPTE